MEITRFIAGKHAKQFGYSSFTPEPVNHEWLVSDAKVNRLLNDATRKLGELNAFSFMKIHPLISDNIILYFSPFTLYRTRSGTDRT